MEERKENRRREHNAGITLIALIITIIILLILAMITIRILMNQGIIKHAQNATEAYNEAQNNELELLAYQESIMRQYSGASGIEVDEDNPEIKKIRAGHATYKQAHINQEDIKKLEEYFLGENKEGKYLFLDIADTSAYPNISFKNTESFPNASEELVYIRLEENLNANVNELTYYIYITYHEQEYKITSVNKNLSSMNFVTQKVETVNKLQVNGANVIDYDTEGWRIQFNDTKHIYAIDKNCNFEKMVLDVKDTDKWKYAWTCKDGTWKEAIPIDEDENTMVVAKVFDTGRKITIPDMGDITLGEGPEYHMTIEGTGEMGLLAIMSFGNAWQESLLDYMKGTSTEKPIMLYTTEVNVGKGVTNIGVGAFAYGISLEKVNIADTVVKIDGLAFSGCESLSGLTIPSTVTTIEDGAFEEVPHIYYNGTAEGAPWGAKAIN